MNNLCLPTLPVSNTSPTAAVLDAAGEHIALIFQPIPGKTIDRIWFRCTASTGGVLDTTLETISGGIPTGTLVAAGASLTGISVAANTSYDNILTTPYAVPTTSPSLLAAVIRYNSGTTASVSSRLGSSLYGPGTDIPRVYEFLNATGTQRAFIPAFTVRYSDGTYHPGYMVNDSFTTNTFASTSNPDEYGNKFTLTSNRKCIGLLVPQRILAGASVRYRVYDSALNVLTTDGQLTFGEELSSSTSSTGLKCIYFSSPIYMSAGSTYYITKTAMNATNIYFYESVWSNAVLKASFHDAMISARRQNDTGAFTEDANKTEHIVPIFETTFSNRITIG